MGDALQAARGSGSQDTEDRLGRKAKILGAASSQQATWSSTGVDSDSRGLTVFLFLISGSFSRPPLASIVAVSLSRFTQRLLVLKNLCLCSKQA